MRPTFEETVNVLVKAYLNDTLVHGACSACAVGNIVSASMGKVALRMPGTSTGFDPHYWADGSKIHWWDVFSTSSRRQRIDAKQYYGDAKEEIDSTGYTWQQLSRIEFAFESADGNASNYQDETWMFNGLMAVVDVLADIHGIDLQAKESAKALFVKSCA
jgi:hypothetical protein